MDKIHVVIPVFNGWKQTKICLDALRTSIYRNLEIIVVDHGSTDETKAVLPIQYPEVVHVLGEPTLWWAGAMNLGIRTALDRGANTVMLLNNDCYVSPETIERLLAHGQQSVDAIIAPKQKDAMTGQTICITVGTCFLLGFPTVLFPLRTARLIGKPKLIPTKIIGGGRGAMIPASVFKSMGLFDEANLPHYYADHDFYLRCRKQGVRLGIATDATVYVDNTRTTLAAKVEAIGFRKFLHTLVNRRSHRNVRDLTALFKLHYPLKGFHHLGVALNLLRYFTLYAWKRLIHMLRLALLGPR